MVGAGLVHLARDFVHYNRMLRAIAPGVPVHGMFNNQLEQIEITPLEIRVAL